MQVIFVNKSGYFYINNHLIFCVMIAVIWLLAVNLLTLDEQKMLYVRCSRSNYVLMMLQSRFANSKLQRSIANLSYERRSTVGMK